MSENESPDRKKHSTSSGRGTMSLKSARMLLIGAFVLLSQQPLAGQTLSMSDYKAIPTFVNQTVPPLVLLTMSKDHRLFYKAYNDVMDLDSDGSLDTTYKDTIDYYGYFDSKKCYSYVSGNSRFEPQGAAGGTNSHTCSSQWSGNFLNWATMARIDVVRKVIYGGYRKVDTAAATVLSRHCYLVMRTLG